MLPYRTKLHEDFTASVTLWQAKPRNAPAWLRPWLSEQGSLSQKLQAQVAAFNIEVLYHGWAVLMPEEQCLLQQDNGYAWVRQVFLKNAQQVLIFAHSITTKQALYHAFNGLVDLGNQPLGTYLFTEQQIKRTRLQWRCIDAYHPLWQMLSSHIRSLPPSLWARRSCFQRGDAKLWVSEMFLPTLRWANDVDNL